MFFIAAIVFKNNKVFLYGNKKKENPTLSPNNAFIIHADACNIIVISFIALFGVVDLIKSGCSPYHDSYINHLPRLKGVDFSSPAVLLPNPENVSGVELYSTSPGSPAMVEYAKTNHEPLHQILHPNAVGSSVCMADAVVPVSSHDSGVLMHQKTKSTPGVVGPKEAGVFFNTFEKNLLQNTRVPYKDATITDIVHHINGYIIKKRESDGTLNGLQFMSKDLYLRALSITNSDFFARTIAESPNVSKLYTNFSEGMCRGYIYAYKTRFER